MFLEQRALRSMCTTPKVSCRLRFFRVGPSPSAENGELETMPSAEMKVGGAHLIY